MKAIKTPTTNRIYVADGCNDLPATVHKIGNDTYTEACFSLTPEEISQIIYSRKIYFSVLGDTIIPMMLHTESYVKKRNGGTRMILRYNKNLYDEVINGNETYKAIATNIKKGFSTFISWTDNDSTHYDVLFTYGCVGSGGYQRGLRVTDLFISVMSIGSFGFKIDDMKSAGYIAEKIFHGRLDKSVVALTELINGVLNGLNKEEE